MILRTITALALLLLGNLVHAQQVELKPLRSWSLTVKAGVLHNYTDIRMKDFWGASYKGKSEHRMGVDVTGTYMVNSALGVQLSTTIGGLTGIINRSAFMESNSTTDRYQFLSDEYGVDEDLYFKTSIFQGNANLYLNLSNVISNFNRVAKGIKTDGIKQRKFSFYSLLGLGLIQFNSQVYYLDTDEPVSGNYLFGKSGNAKELLMVYGVGVKFRVNEKIDIGLEYKANRLATDKLDGFEYAFPDRANNDAYTMMATAITIKLGSNKRDAEHLEWITPLEAYHQNFAKEVVALKDSDQDGVFDIVDLEADSPKDAIVDTKGVTMDSDNDGCPDYKDPEPYSNISFPIVDCKNVKNLALNQADSDNDGVIDEADKCPLTAGTLQNSGCPKNAKFEIEKSDLEWLGNVANSIEFESGTAKLKTSSFEVLEQVVVLLKKYPGYYCKIEGHTDNKGRTESNLELSHQRATAALDFINTNGINAVRLTAVGYGDLKPVATNVTPGGQAKNRRVEFRLHH